MTTIFNGWQRIGIVLSILWCICVCGYTAYEYVNKGDTTSYLIEVTQNKPSFDSQGHKTMTIEEFVGGDVKRNLNVIHVLSVIFIPITLAWVIIYLCIFIYRWVIAGFRTGGK